MLISRLNGKLNVLAFFSRLPIAVVVTALVLAVVSSLVWFWLPEPTDQQMYWQHVRKGREQLAEDDTPMFGRTDLMGESLRNAEAEFQKALSLRPTGYEAVYGVGRCYEFMSQYYAGRDKIALIEDAAFFLRKVISATPDDEEKALDLTTLSAADYFEGDKRGAKRDAQAAVKLRPDLERYLFAGSELRPPSLERDVVDDY